MKWKIIIRHVDRFFVITLVLVLLLQGCMKSDADDERQNTVRLLANDGSKKWVLEKSNIDNNEVTLSKCDSAYVLIMKSDLTWKEEYLNAQCYTSGYGNWTLNDANNVLSIQFIDPRGGAIVEKRFEIVELSEMYFAYQFAENNRLKYVRMRNDGRF